MFKRYHPRNKFGTRRQLRRLQRKLKREEDKLRITANVDFEFLTQKDKTAGQDLMSEEVFEKEMKVGFKRED